MKTFKKLILKPKVEHWYYHFPGEVMDFKCYSKDMFQLVDTPHNRAVVDKVRYRMQKSYMRDYYMLQNFLIYQKDTAPAGYNEDFVFLLKKREELWKLSND